MTKKLLLAAAFATVVFGAGMSAPAQAHMADPALSQAVPGATETVQYRRYHRRHWRGRHWRGGRYWHCWRGWHGRRHCSWRYR